MHVTIKSVINDIDWSYIPCPQEISVFGLTDTYNM